MGKSEEMLLRALLQMGICFTFRLGLKCVKELWAAFCCKLGT